MKTIACLLLLLAPAGLQARTPHQVHEDLEHHRVVHPINILYPNGISRGVFDKPYPDRGCITQARAYIYDRTYDRNAPYCRGWKNGEFGISLDGITK